MQQILRLFPPSMRDQLLMSGILQKQLEEIRIRVNQPISFWSREGEFFLKKGQLCRTADRECQRMTPELVCQMCMLMSKYSLYAYEDEIKKGYLTVEGGHRIGVCGMVSQEAGKIRRMHPVFYLNIRIAREWIGCADEILPKLVEDQMFQNTLILSAPGIGKTTLLRDLIRQLSDGSAYLAGQKVGLVDERSEIAGCQNGIPQNDVGMRTDVLDNCPKVEGMMLLIRSMSPEILAVDELGGAEDFQALHQAVYCGCRLAATIHSTDVWELLQKPGWNEYVRECLFRRYVVLKTEHNRRVYQVFDEKLEKLC